MKPRLIFSHDQPKVTSLCCFLLFLHLSSMEAHEGNNKLNYFELAPQKEQCYLKMKTLVVQIKKTL